MSEPLTKDETQELIDENPHLGIIDRHAESVSKAKLVLIVVCCIAIVVSFAVTKIEFSGVQGEIRKVESPCLRYGSNSQQCHESFQAAINSITDYQLCALLSKRPDLTGVNAADCQRIAREARKQIERHRQAAARSGSNSAAGSSPAPSASNQPVANTSPQGGGSQHEAGSGHQGGSQTGGQHAPSPAPPDSPSPQSPLAPSPSPGESGHQSESSEAQPQEPAQENPSKPSSVVEVEAPGLPVQACVPGVLGVNCPR